MAVVVHASAAGSAGSTALVPDDSGSQLITGSDAAASGAVRRPKFVLNEDEYTETIQTIIHRDFFPAIPYLEQQLGINSAAAGAQTPAVPATERRAPNAGAGVSATPTPSHTSGLARARAAAEATAAVLAGRAVPAAAAAAAESTPAPGLGGSFEEDTPLHPSLALSRSSSSSAAAAAGGGAAASDAADGADRSSKKLKKEDLRLNAFLLTHTSEDNAAFDVLMAKGLREHRDRYGWLHAQAKAHELTIIESTQPDNERRQLGTWNQSSQRNNLMFSAPDPSPEAERERRNAQIAAIASARTAPAQVVYENTRFPGPLFEPPKPKPVDPAGAAADAAAAKDKSVVGGPSAASTPAIGGYKLMRTPSPAPGVGANGEPASPLMTWGDVVGTPLHLSIEDIRAATNHAVAMAGGAAAVASGGKGSVFRVPPTPSRDELLWSITSSSSAAAAAGGGGAASNSKRKRADGTPAGVRTPAAAATPNRSGGTTPLSAAGQRLLRSAVLKGGAATPKTADLQLRMSYASPAVAAGVSGSSSSSRTRSGTKSGAASTGRASTRATPLSIPTPLLSPKPHSTQTRKAADATGAVALPIPAGAVGAAARAAAKTKVPLFAAASVARSSSSSTAAAAASAPAKSSKSLTDDLL